MPLPANRKRPHSAETAAPDGSGNNVKVVVRIRPQNSMEVEGNHRVVVQAVNENILVFDPRENSHSDYGPRKRPRDIRKRPNKDLKFGFDYVFDQDTNNADVFRETTRSTLDSFLEGYNCSVFAYGATGAGKTHTMLGNRENPGVIYQTMMALYDHIDNVKDTKTCDIAVSYLEVYNETIRDLLVPKGVLPIREDPGKGVVIPGLSLHKPKTAEELLHMLQFGNQHRTQHPTDANAESSRSHAVFQVFIRQKDRTANISTEVRVAKMCLVDLAGSERATVTKNRGSRLREGANINRSLLALGNVINALAENKKSGFIPYRDSKLTRLLKDSLGGNCHTVMIAAVSPSAMSYEDTYNTLRYADRAKHIKAILKKNVLSVDFHMAKYGQIVEELRREISELKGKLRTAEDKQGPVASVQGPAVLPETFIGYQEELSKYFSSHQCQKNTQLHEEICLRNLQWKMYRKERCLARLQAIDEPCNLEAKKSMEAIVGSLHQKTSCLSITSDNSRKKVQESSRQLADVEQNMRASVGQNGLMAELLSLSIQAQKLQCELQDIQQQLGYTRQVVKCQEKELNHNERLLLQLLKLLKVQHYLLQGRDLLTPDLQEAYQLVQRRVGAQELVWQDEQAVTGYPKKYTLNTMLDLPCLSEQSCPAEPAPRSTLSGSLSGGLPEQRLQPEADSQGQVYQFSAKQAPFFKSMPLKVDECSPPKAKRVMLASRSTADPPRRVNKPRMPHQSTAQSRGWRTPNKREHPDNRSAHKKANTKSVAAKSPFGKSVSNNSRTPVKNVVNDNTPEEESVKTSKFSFVTDTITKAKKFAHLHVQSHEKKEEHELDETFTLDHDGTFTVDPSVNSIPVSEIPCVDGVAPSQCETQKTVLTEQWVDRSVSSSGSQSVNSARCHQNSSQSTHVVSQAYSSSCHQSCNSIVSESRPGSQTDYSPDLSGTSTIMNQSGNSQSSLVSMSTLVEGQQNLSQNLSNTEESCPTSFVNATKCEQVEERLNIDTSVDDIQSVCDRPSLVSSETVTKDKPHSAVDSRTVTKEEKSGLDSDTSQNLNCHKPTKAARSIKFDNVENNSNEGKSCVETIRTPERKPLRQVGNITPTRLSTDSNSSLNKSPIIPASQRLNQQQQKENSKILNKYGMPSLIEGSILSKDPALKRQLICQTPGYMKPTKAHNQRARHNTSQNSSLDTSDEGGHSNNQMDRNRSKRINRPLMPHMRSKSMSSLSARSGWQI